MTMTIIDNDHGDKGDEKEDSTDIPKDISSEEFRTSNPESGPEFHRFYLGNLHLRLSFQWISKWASGCSTTTIKRFLND